MKSSMTVTDLSEWENKFFLEFFKMTAQVMAIGKNDEVALRLVKFINSFCTFSSSSESKDSTEEERGIFTRFMDNFIQCLLHGVEAKEKNVRHRACLLLDGSICAVDEMRNDLLELFVASYQKGCLIRRQSLELLQFRLYLVFK